MTSYDTHRTTAAALVAGPTVFAVADLLRRVVLPSDGDPLGQQLQRVHDHDGIFLLAGLLALAAPCVWAYGTVGLVGKVAGRGSRLLRVGTVAMLVGLAAAIGHAVAFYGILGTMVRSDQDPAALAAVNDASESYPLLVVLIVLFIAGVMLGVILQTIGLRRARLVPVWVPVAAVVFVVAGSTGGVAAGIVGVVAALLTFVPVARVLATTSSPPVASDSAPQPLPRS